MHMGEDKYYWFKYQAFFCFDTSTTDEYNLDENASGEQNYPPVIFIQYTYLVNKLRFYLGYCF